MNRCPTIPTMGREAMLLLLTCGAGSVDAISYLGLGHVFTAMMTGNTVLLGLAIGQGHASAAFRSIVALIGFGGGVATGAMIVQRSRADSEWPSAVTGALAVEGMLLGLFALLWYFTGAAPGEGARDGLILISGFAMGIQSAAVQRLDVPGVMTTYITGTLTSLFVGLVGRVHSAQRQSPATGSAGTPVSPVPAAGPKDRRLGLLAAVFLAYALGASAGGILLLRLSVSAALLPLASVAIVTANATIRQRSGQKEAALAAGTAPAPETFGGPPSY